MDFLPVTCLRTDVIPFNSQGEVLSIMAAPAASVDARESS